MRTRLSSGNQKEKRLLAKPRRRWKITKVNLIACEAGNSIQLTEVIITSHSPI